MKNKDLNTYFDKYHKAFIAWRKSLSNDTFDNRQMRMTCHNETLTNIPENFEFTLKDFYSKVKNWRIKWTLNPKFKTNIKGSINILPIEEVLIGDIDLLPNEFPIMKNFTLLDYFYNESAVGFYLDKPENGLYYFAFDGTTQKLNLNFKGYLEMLNYTKGVAYWQLSIIEPENRQSSVIEEMNELFPDITVEGFFDLYEQVRLH